MKFGRPCSAGLEGDELPAEGAGGRGCARQGTQGEVHLQVFTVWTQPVMGMVKNQQ